MNLKNIFSLSQASLVARAKAFQWGYEYLQGRMRSLGRDGWAQDCDGEIEHRANARPDATNSERAYLGLLEHLTTAGQYKPNRTGVGTFADVGHMLKFDLRDGFPAVTTKKLAFNAVKGELLGFFRGYDNAADFRALGCKVWDQNANETPSWVNNPNRKGTDDLGRIYGVQWTKWRDTRIARTPGERVKFATSGYTLVADDKERNVAVYERTLNQLEDALRTLLTNPYDRRIIINGWRPDEFDLLALPPCHVAYQLVALPDNTLHITMWQRSTDAFLGWPFNQASTALMLALFARLTGRTAATVTMFSSDTHVYENHVEQVREQVAREPFKAPTLVLSDNIKQVKDVSEVSGVFERIEPSDIQLKDYEHHPALAAPMAA